VIVVLPVTVATTLVGATGAVVTEDVADEASLVPLVLEAVTVKV
jgi:hypothetical protein